MQRKPGGYRSPSRRNESLASSAKITTALVSPDLDDLRGTSSPKHPAPYPLEFAERLIRMFSFVGDTVLDPFMGTGTTNLACARWDETHRIELDADYFDLARNA